VAVTRAKEALYVIGNKELWKDIGVFKELYDNVEVISSYEPVIYSE
jgi:superfamily I DNA and/or RNA helicase